MPKRKRRHHAPAFKAKVAFAATQGDRTLAELAAQFDVQPNQIQEWKKKLVASAEQVFGAGASEAVEAEREIEKLHAKIGQLTMENDFVSKALGRDRGANAEHACKRHTRDRNPGVARCWGWPARRRIASPEPYLMRS